MTPQTYSDIAGNILTTAGLRRLGVASTTVVRVGMHDGRIRVTDDDGSVLGDLDPRTLRSGELLVLLVRLGEVK